VARRIRCGTSIREINKGNYILLYSKSPKERNFI
jgi:hypothetical protein